MKRLLVLAGFVFSSQSFSQELYVFTEPASNMPAHSISLKLTGQFFTSDASFGRFAQRYYPQVMFGLNKKLMLHAGLTFANVHTSSFQYESASVYLKYRFLSHDDIHEHFRMAAFLDASITRSPFQFDEIGLMGDKSGVEGGLIATQLLNRLALSATLSHTQVLDKTRKNRAAYNPPRSFASLNYSFSAGYLLFPKEYTDYNQTNLNIYTEILGQRLLDIPGHYIDMAPAIQLIFKSNLKLNVGYRFQLAGNMQRINGNSWLVSLERTFLGALK